MSDLIPIPTAATKYNIDVKRLRGYVWRDDGNDPIGSFKTDEVYDDWRLKKLQRAADKSPGTPNG